jgi:hypothetical protein
MAIGQISGQLLKDDLQRDGRNLSFDTNLLFLDVVNRRIGINNASPTDAVDVTGRTRSTNLKVNTQADIASITVNTNTITSNTGTLSLNPSAPNAVVVQAKLQVDNLELTSNNINALGTNKDININPTGSGKLVIGTALSNKDVLINGSLHATGNITFSDGGAGTIQFGDANTDSITFNADVISDIRPDQTELYSLGTTDNRWLNTYTKNLYTTNLNATTITLANGINLSLAQGKTWYVATNGGDTKLGNHQNDPFASVTKALTVAQPGDTIYIYPGTYTETFPMSVPAGVTVKGAGIRSVLIQPTSGTRNKDGFLITGEVTIEDLTLANFEYDSIGNTGYGFRLKSGFKVSSRSPYIRNCSVITAGSTVRLATNPANDPRGFLAGDAGRGALFDGSVADATSKDVSVLFHSTTFITPGATCIRVSNGVKIEWLNSFIYFADKGFDIQTNLGSAGGQFGTAQVGLKIPASGRVGTWNVGNTLTYYDTDGTTVLATGTIASISGDWVYITGYQTGFITISDRVGKTVFIAGDAKLSTAQKKFNTASLVLDGTGDYINLGSDPDFGFGLANRPSKPIAVTGNTVVSATQSKFGGASVFFDGTGDYISTTIPYADLGFGTGEYTIEFWAYRTVTQLGTIIDFHPSGAGNYHQVNLSSTGLLRYSINGATVITGATLTLNTWCHVAITRSGTSVKMFFNGNQTGVTYTDSTNYPASALTIGSSNLGANGYGGYLDEVRISNNAKYTGTFITPAASFTPDINSVFLMHGDSTISDDADDQTVGEFALESWVYPTTTGTTKVLFDLRATAGDTDGIVVGINSSNQLYFYLNGSNRIGPAGTINIAVWTHIALTRVGGFTKLFVNGIQVGTSYIDTNNYSQRGVRIGADIDGNNLFTGYIDEIRISKGAGRYSATFTPLASEFASDAKTVLLLHLNGANNSTTLTDDGVRRQDLRTSTGGTATIITYADYTKFGAEIRSIGSANVYGNYGFVGDGPGCIAYLVGHNLAYVGAGRFSNNDPTSQIKANEIVKTNGAKIYFSSIDNIGNYRVGDYFEIDQKNGNVTFNGASFNIPSQAAITLTDGVNTTILDATKVQTGNIVLSGNTISTLSGDLNLTAYSGVVRINSTNNFIIPVGTTLQRPSPGSNGMIRYNTTESWYEGYSGSQWVPFGVVSDLTRTTQILTDVTPGDQTLSFYANNTLAATLTSTAFNVNRVNVGNFDISSNTITPVTSNTDISIQPTGTGGTRISNIRISTNTIENTTNNAITTIKTNGDGYVKFTGVNGVVIPVGDNLNRPSSPVTGLIRYNTQLGTTELYDGTQWGGLSGQSGAITIGTAQDIAIAMVIILG